MLCGCVHVLVVFVIVGVCVCLCIRSGHHLYAVVVMFYFVLISLVATFSRKIILAMALSSMNPPTTTNSNHRDRGDNLAMTTTTCKACVSIPLHKYMALQMCITRQPHLSVYPANRTNNMGNVRGTMYNTH